ncbi:CIA30 family protein [Glacieibacterium frigidum]|uniref:Amidohydrolase family protein n=1 Tax=Glacieibacterium frigidum TaxID=2593303 RepID=A0A552UHF6_9SPHN|nr:CIA30 family protein [Glacieibacterium frigidum]TRW17664.1 amidohydrolase family protein [Glacieibacterium frigidum]
MSVRGLVLGLLVAAAPAFAAPVPTLIENVAVFDGARRLPPRAVLLSGGKIADPDFKGRPPAGAKIVDGRGKTLLPGLIDSHVHAFQDQDVPLLFGVTTQLDMFSPAEATRDVRSRMNSGTNAATADIVTAGILATVPGGHGTQFGLAVPTLTTPAEADAWVAARIAEGSDFIKIVDQDGSAARPLPTLDAATVRALVVAAHKRGRLAVVHVQKLRDALEAIDAGADGMVHLYFDKEGGEDFARRAKAAGVFIVPTYAVFEGFHGRAGGAPLLDRPGLAGLLTKPASDNVRQTFGADRSAKLDAVVGANMKALVKAGVPILAGTDSGNPGTAYGLSMHRELELLVKAGLTPTQALTAATAAPAKAFRLADRGRIAKGLKADLLMVDGDPTVDIAATQAIAEIWKDGEPVSPLRAARRAAIAATPTGPAAAAVTLPADGRIGLFAAADGKPKLTSPFGLGWAASTDSIAGGKSTVSLSVAGAAPNGQPALVMTGEINPAFMAPWAGVAFNPAAQPFAPVDLGAATGVRLWVRGEGQRFVMMGFSTAGGQVPAVAPMTVGAEWREVTVRFADLKNFNRANTMLLLFGAHMAPGPFRLEIADVRLLKD